MGGSSQQLTFEMESNLVHLEGGLCPAVNGEEEQEEGLKKWGNRCVILLVLLVYGSNPVRPCTFHAEKSDFGLYTHK